VRSDGLVNRDDGWRMPDRLWERIEPLLPDPPPHPLGCHRPRVPNRRAMDAILLVLRTGMRWNALAATGLCSSSSAHRRFQEWQQAGVFAELQRLWPEQALWSGARLVRWPQPNVVAGAWTSSSPPRGSPMKKSWKRVDVPVGAEGTTARPAATIAPARRTSA
jgi:transposase